MSFRRTFSVVDRFDDKTRFVATKFQHVLCSKFFRRWKFFATFSLAFTKRLTLLRDDSFVTK